MKILLSLPEFPFGCHGGAARSMRTMAEWMAARGHQVECVATTATERPCDWSAMLHGLDNPPCGASVTHRGISYRMVPTPLGKDRWRSDETEGYFDTLFDTALASLQPDIVLCYGGYPRDEDRFDRAKRQGAKLVFGLRNFGYTLKPRFFKRMDGVITCSQFLTDWYKKTTGIDSTPLPLPIEPDDVIAETREPIYFTAINPARRKGSMILETVFRALRDIRPDIPLLIAGESSEPEFEHLKQYAKVLPWQTNPKTIYASTKVLLVPSVWEEPAGRVIVEAMMNGIPPIITDRGGMVETANYGAFVLPLAKHVTRDLDQPVGLDVAQPWIDLITELHDGGGLYYLEKSHRAKEGVRNYWPQHLAPRYEQFFEEVLCSRTLSMVGR